MADPTAIQQVRAMLKDIGESRFRRRAVMPFGFAALDARLAEGGLRLDALHEVTAASSELADAAAAMLFVAGIAARTWGPVLWAARRRDLFAPDPVRAGLAAPNILYIDASGDADLLAIMEEGLRHRGLGAVVGEVQRTTLSATQRLQAAAGGGRTVALLLKGQSRSSDPLATPSAAATRWRVGCAPATVRPATETRRPRWKVELAYQTDGDPFEQVVEACDATGRCAMPADPARRAAILTTVRDSETGKAAA